MLEEREILEQEVLEHIRRQYGKISPAEKKVADRIIEQPQEVVNYNVSELARTSGVSDATVIRLCYHLGYSGYHQFRIMLAKDLGKQQKKAETSEVADDAIGRLFGEYAETMIAIGRRLNLDTIQKCVEFIKAANTVHIIAVGNTTNLTGYMGFRLGRLGVKSTCHDLPEYFINDINLADERDVVLAVSKSGSSKRVLDGIELAKGKGMKIIAITASDPSPVSKLADLVLLSSGKQEPYNIYKSYSFLNELAVIDALLRFLHNDEWIKEKQADRPEMLLAETKL